MGSSLSHKGLLVSAIDLLPFFAMGVDGPFALVVHAPTTPLFQGKLFKIRISFGAKFANCVLHRSCFPPSNEKSPKYTHSPSIYTYSSFTLIRAR